MKIVVPRTAVTPARVKAAPYASPASTPSSMRRAAPIGSFAAALVDGWHMKTAPSAPICSHWRTLAIQACQYRRLITIENSLRNRLSAVSICVCITARCGNI